MEYQLTYSYRVYDDIDNALEYYSAIRPSLADRFFAEVTETFEKLTVTPENYSFVSVNDNVRDVLLPSFPYNIVYQIQNEIVYIIAVASTYQRPLYY